MSTSAQQEAYALCNRGVARTAAGAVADALVDFGEALELDPGCAEAFNNRGFVRLLLSDARGAGADFDQALRLNPCLASAYSNRGGLRLAVWDLHGALADLDAALALDPQHYPSYLARANTRYHLRDLGAEDDFRAAFRLDAAYTARTIVSLLLQVLQEDGPGRILTDCEKHLRFNPGDFHSRARRGLLCVLLSRDAEAQADFDEYRRLNPGGTPFLDVVIEEAKRQAASTSPSGAASTA
jgi:tetratricopeptide (TPR) repeat protein